MELALVMALILSFTCTRGLTHTPQVWEKREEELKRLLDNNNNNNNE